MTDHELPDFVVIDDNSHRLASNICGLANPDRLVAFLVEGLSMDDPEDEGNLFALEAFRPGQAQGVFAVLPTEDAEKMFNMLSVYLKGRRAPKELAGQEAEAAVALWEASEDTSAILVVDSNDTTQQILQTVWEEGARVLKFGAYEEGRVVAQDRFDAAVVAQGDDGLPVVDAIKQFLASSPTIKQRRSPSSI